MSRVESIPFDQAWAYAEKIAEWLRPFCLELRLAGSIRRERPQCGDVDLVVIPRTTALGSADLFGGEPVRRNELHAVLTDYVRNSDGRASWKLGADSPWSENVILQLPKVQLDIFLATPETIGSVLLCRTGSKEHNIYLAQRAAALGKAWVPNRGVVPMTRAKAEGLYDGGLREAVAEPAPDEASVYHALQLPFIGPVNRERAWLERQFGPPDRLYAGVNPGV